MLSIVRLLLPLVLLIPSGMLAAQEPPPATAPATPPAPVTPPAPPSARDLDPVVLTATKLETRAEQLGSSVTVVPGDDVQKYHFETVEDVLRNVPGVEARFAQPADVRRWLEQISRADAFATS